MAGNVWEWVSTKYQDYPYDGENNGSFDSASQNATRVVIRGGSWNNNGNYLRSTNRYSYVPDHLDTDIGFRCLRL